MKAITSGNTNHIKYIFLSNILSYKGGGDALITKYAFFLFYFFNISLYKKTCLYSRTRMEAILKRFFFLLAAFD